jgi:hypothetical protein
MAKRCPPGIWCLTPTTGIFLGILIFLIGFITWQLHNQKAQSPIIVQIPQPQQQESQNINLRTVVENRDSRYSISPEPYREWLTTPDLRGALIPQGAMPIFQPTGSYPDKFQQMGIIMSETPGKILPLYGRRTGNRSDRYNYYTRTDSFNPVQIPVRYERRDCMDDVGCQELLGGEKIFIEGLQEQGTVKVYRYDAPRYIPAVY